MTVTHNDVDSDVSFEDDADEEMDTTVIEEEDSIEYTKRSTEEAIEKMESAKIRCWNKTHKKMKWKLALRIATSRPACFSTQCLVLIKGRNTPMAKGNKEWEYT